MNTVSTIRMLPETKEQQKKFVQIFAEEFANLQDYEQAKMFVQLKIVSDTIELMIKHPEVREQIIKRMENKLTETNFGVVAYSERKSFDFSNDPEWQQLKFQADISAKNLKAHEGLLKALAEDMTDRSTGEIRIKPSVSGIEVLTVKY